MSPSSDFESLICDMQCVISACERSYKYDGQRPLSMLIFKGKGDPSPLGHWISRALPARLAYRLLLEAERRGFYAVRLELARGRSVRTVVADTFSGYKQRRLGVALMRHRAALAVVVEAGGLGDMYDNASRQLQKLAVQSRPGWGEIRRVEKFARCVRLSAHHALLARDLEICH
jgi:hypothetical protein